MSQFALTEELSKFVLPIAQFEGLCLEARDAQRIADFWVKALGGNLHEVGPGRLRIDPAPDRPTKEILRIDTAADLPRDVSRVHLDLRLKDGDPHHLLAAGARLIRNPGPDPWYVLADPEGNTFCAYPAVDQRPAGIFELVVKCRDAHAQARWWAEILDGDVVVEGEAAAVKAAPDFPWDYMLFDPVPEPKVFKNRLHWHLNLRDRNPAALLAAGASVRRRPGTPGGSWDLADPEGNEFCAHPARH